MAQLIQGAGAALAGVELAGAKVDGDRATWTLDQMLQDKVGQAVERFAAREAIHADMNRLKAIGIALQNYHDVHKHFPDVAIRDAKGEPLLSWRVAILPYLKQDQLYKQFHLDEPWDSEHNRKLIDSMPDVFRSFQTPPGRTRFLAPVGESLAFTPEKGGLNIKSFTDGTSLTIMIVEADAQHAVVWTKPEDLPVDLDNPKRGISDGSGAFATAFADASAHRIAGSVDPQVLRKFFTRNGREPANRDDLYPAQ